MPEFTQDFPEFGSDDVTPVENISIVNRSKNLKKVLLLKIHLAATIDYHKARSTSGEVLHIQCDQIKIAKCL